MSVTCLLRGLPLFFRAAPKTPLRVLCIIALDTLHVLRHSQPLPRKRISELATFLDFQACTNAAWDHKDLCEAEYQAIRQRLEKAGLGSWIEEYLGRLRELERRRPSIGGDHRRFDEVRSYREAVARLSLATVTAIALNARAPRRGHPGDAWRPRCGNALSDRDAVPDHRRRRGLRRGSVRGPAEFSDRIGVAAAGHGIDCQSGTVVCRGPRACIRRTASFRCAWH